MVVRQGEVYWVDLGEPAGSRSGFRRPYVVVQNDRFNESRIQTIVVCAVTSTLWLAAAPGNVLIGQGEAGLPRDCVVNVSHIESVDRQELDELIGQLPRYRVEEIVRGIRLLIEPHAGGL